MASVHGRGINHRWRVRPSGLAGVRLLAGGAVVTAHTPGPWRIGNRHPCRVIAVRESPDAGTWVADTCREQDEGTEQPEQLANARLIAAAPETAAERDRLKALNAELLAALQAFVTDCDERATGRFHPMHPTHEICVAARAAIAKARGA